MYCWNTTSEHESGIKRPRYGLLKLRSQVIVSPLAGTKLYCLVTKAHRCEQLVQDCYAALSQVGFEPATCWSQVQRYTRCATAPLRVKLGRENFRSLGELPSNVAWTKPCSRCLCVRMWVPVTLPNARPMFGILSARDSAVNSWRVIIQDPSAH